LVSSQSNILDKNNWVIRFSVPNLSSLKGDNVCLTIGIASFYIGYVHTDYALSIYLNGNSIGKLNISSQTTESCLVRVGIEGVYQQFNNNVGLKLLQSTNNIITLNSSATTTNPAEYMPNAGIMYDFVLLEGLQ